MQVHGGLGFIEQTGVAQLYRDARIAPIYEGTNGIQANDLVGRKLMRDGGDAARAFFQRIHTAAAEAAGGAGALPQIGTALGHGLTALEQATQSLIAIWPKDKRLALSGATPYLTLFGLGDGRLFAGSPGLGRPGPRQRRRPRFSRRQDHDRAILLRQPADGGARPRRRRHLGWRQHAGTAGGGILTISEFKIAGIAAVSRALALVVSLNLGLTALLPDPAYADTTDSTAPVTTEEGLTLETAIRMPPYKTSLEGIAAERAHFTKVYSGWKKTGQALISKDGRQYDRIILKGPGGATKELYFDITNWFGAPLFPPE